MNRVALISEHASPLGFLGGVDAGGQNVYVGQLARHLAALGYAVDVFTRRDDVETPEIVPWEGARVIQVPAGPPRRVRKEELLPHMDAFAAFLLAFMRRQGAYDLIHANFFMSAWVALQVRRALGTPVVVTFHALGQVRKIHQKEADQFPPQRLDIEAQAVAAADRIVAECPQDRDDLLHFYQARPERLRLVPCGFDPQEFWPIPQAVSRRRLGLEPHSFLILQLGRMVPRKGVDNVLRGVARFQRLAGVDAKVLIVGGESRQPDPRLTPELGRLRQIAEEAGILDSVVFVGSRDRSELRDFYCAADVFVTTPWYEPFGMTPLEAMACGRPVIGANVGGIKFTVRDGETGFLVPPHDPDALAQKLACLYRDRAAAERMGGLGRRRAEAFFSWARVAGMLAEVYREVCGECHADLPDYHRALAPENFKAWEAWQQSEPVLADGSRGSP
jgi:D-inositol-3-phosphate glycosyltransferase